MNNSLINNEQAIPIHCDLIAAHFAHIFPAPLVKNNMSCVCLRRNWQLNHVKRLRICVSTRHERRRQKRSGRWRWMHQQYLQKVRRFSPGTQLSLKQTRKELMSALIREQLNADGEQWTAAFFNRSGHTWWGGVHCSTLCMKSA